MPKTKAKAPTTDNTQITALESKLARALADYQNLEKRFERDSSSVVKFANINLLEQLLDFRDHLALSARTLSDHGLAMLLKELDQLLVAEGVVEIDTKEGFDPSCMECTELVPGDSNQIISVVRPGYRLHERVLRPARVQMGAGKVINKNK